MLQVGKASLPYKGSPPSLCYRHASFTPGVIVYGMVQMQDWQVGTATGNAGVRWVTLHPLLREPLEVLTLLNLNNLTAYFFLRDLGRPKPKQTVLVSAGAGHVGSAVAQMASLLGCRTVAVCGSDAKVKQCKDLFGYDAAVRSCPASAPPYECKSRRGHQSEQVNYKAYASDPMALTGALRAACPGGVDVFFDNTSGDLPLAILPVLNIHSRWVVCGRIALAGLQDTLRGDVGVRDASYLITKRIVKIGGLVFDFFPRALEAHLSCIKWQARGKFTISVDAVEGIAQAVPAQLRLLSGDHMGKMVVMCARPMLSWPRSPIMMACRAVVGSVAFPTDFVCWLLRMRARWGGRYCGH